LKMRDSESKKRKGNGGDEDSIPARE